jgi:hypothetical protein
MSLHGMSALGFGLGLVGLAGILALLHLLRVRHREVSVVTTLFWREALEETRARVFRRRFRHPAAWALLFLICALLWVAIAQPGFDGTRARRTVCVLDGSAAMQAGTAFPDALAQVEADVQGLPAAQTEVVLVGGTLRTLLAPGEDRLLLARRAATVQPEDAPSTVAAFLRRLAQEAGDAPIVRYYGITPLPAPEPAWQALEIQRIEPKDTVSVGARITALGLAESQSGAWDRVDVLVEVQGSDDTIPPASLLRVALDGAAVSIAPVSETRPPDRRVWRYLDVPARGQHLVASIEATGQEAQRAGPGARAERDLPARRVLRVVLDAALEASLSSWIAADPACEVVSAQDAGPDVRIVASAAPPVDDLPTLWFAPGDDESAAFEIRAPESDLPAADVAVLLERLRAPLALAEIDGASLATALGRAIEVRTETGPTRRVRLWQRLLEEDVGFVSSRAAPLFLSGALRWLAGLHPVRPVLAAGASVTETAGAVYVDAEERPQAAVGDLFTPPVAGRYVERATGRALHASLLSPRPASDDAVAATAAAAATAPVSLATLCILLAFALLFVEWFLLRSGRIP